MNDTRAMALRRREFLCAGSGCVLAPAVVGLASPMALGQHALSVVAEHLVGLRNGRAATVASLHGGSVRDDLASLSLSERGISELSDSRCALEGLLVEQGRSALHGDAHGCAAIRVAGCTLAAHERGTHSLDVEFQTDDGPHMVHALSIDCASCSGTTNGGGWMEIPTHGGGVTLAATSNRDGAAADPATQLTLPARRGVHFVGWRDPRTCALPRWNAVRVCERVTGYELVNRRGAPVGFTYALVVIDEL